MSAYCTSCGSPLPDNQGSRSCSMCYGDIDHGRDNYYQDWAESQQQEQDHGPDGFDEHGYPTHE